MHTQDSQISSLCHLRHRVELLGSTPILSLSLSLSLSLLSLSLSLSLSATTHLRFSLAVLLRPGPSTNTTTSLSDTGSRFVKETSTWNESPARTSFAVCKRNPWSTVIGVNTVSFAFLLVLVPFTNHCADLRRKSTQQRGCESVCTCAIKLSPSRVLENIKKHFCIRVS